jgi:hypothetical protein
MASCSRRATRKFMGAPAALRLLVCHVTARLHDRGDEVLNSVFTLGAETHVLPRCGRFVDDVVGKRGCAVQLR